MINLITVYSSNIPIDCHVLKGRLEADGISCFIYDENMVWVDPFSAVAISGVKLKVPFDQVIQSRKIISLINQGKLTDENGEYPVSEVMHRAIERQNELISVKNTIRNDISLMDRPHDINSTFIDRAELDEIIEAEREFQELAKKKFKFSWEQFFYELFDFDRDFFKYFKPRPVNYYLEKEMVDHCIHPKETTRTTYCPECNSEDTAYGLAIDYKWDIPYLLLSFLLGAPFFPFRNKHHCFDCGHDFKKRKMKATDSKQNQVK